MSFDVQSTQELPMHTLRTSTSFSDGEDPAVSVISNLADAITHDMLMPRRGDYSDQLHARFKAADVVSRAILTERPPDDAPHISGKERAAMKQYEHAKQVLSRFGIDLTHIGIDEAFVIKEFAEAIDATNKMIDTTEPQSSDSEQNVLLTADAIANWMDMFIKLHQRFNLRNDEVVKLFDHLFATGKIRRLLSGCGLDGIFIPGVYGELTAYLYLYESKEGCGKFTVPRHASDSASAIDLIWEADEGPQNGIEYFDVKSDSGVEQPVFVNVSNPVEYDDYCTSIQETYASRPDACRARLRSADRMRSFAQQATTRNPAATCYSLRVPSLKQRLAI